MNCVKLYSNGTAVITREYTFKDEVPLRVSIPVRKTDLDDVISSLSVFGDVTITAPPTYIPTNAQETALTLNPANVLQDLVTKLAGAAVEIAAGAVYVGKLVGLHRYRQEVGGSVLKKRRLVVLTDKGVQQIDETAVAAIRFVDPAIQSEIDKALAASLSELKPDSSVVGMTIQPNPGAANALVTYATPVAAWKIRYQLRLSATDATLEVQAVVDNDTDDDWVETMITVITGEPITFSTDLAEIRRPARSRVNIVADRTTGAVTPEAEILEYEMHASYMPAAGAGAVLSAAPMAKIESAKRLRQADQTQAEVRESGDFSMYQSANPVTVGAKRSAIIPLFRTVIGNASPVLFYKEQDDKQRPFQAVRFTNETNHSLGRGICEIFVDGDFQGKCVLESTKTGEVALLIHAKETGVRVFKDAGRAETRRTAIRITEGTVCCEELSRQEIAYRIQNSHPKSFALEIEHSRSWKGSQLRVSVSTGTCETSMIPSGQRIRVALEARGALVVSVIEELLVTQSLSLDAAWLQSNATEQKAGLSNNEDVKKCVALQGKINDLQTQLTVKLSETKTLDDEQKRLMKLIPNGHAEQANEWRTDLANSEKELREIKRTAIPELNRQLQVARSELQEALRKLQVTWADQSGK